MDTHCGLVIEWVDGSMDIKIWGWVSHEISDHTLDILGQALYPIGHHMLQIVVIYECRYSNAYTELLMLTDGLSGHVTTGGNDRQIPLLRKVYEQFPNMPMNVDVKVDSEELIQKVPTSKYPST